MNSSLIDKQDAMRAEFEGHRTIAKVNDIKKEDKRKRRAKVIKVKPRKTYPWHDQAIIMNATGTSKTAIAKNLSKAPSTIGRFLESEGAKERALVLLGGRSIEDIRADLKSLAPLAMLAIKALMESKDPAHIVSKAEKGIQILKAIGAEMPDESKVEHTHNHFDDFAQAIEDIHKKEIIGSA